MSEESDMAYWTVYPLDGDPELPCIANCPSTVDLGPYLTNIVPPGNPVFVFTSLPSEILLADPIEANFNTGFIVSADYQTNRNNAAAMIASPPEVATTPQDRETTTAVIWPAAT